MNFRNDGDHSIVLIVFKLCIQFRRSNMDLNKEYPVCEQVSHFHLGMGVYICEATLDPLTSVRYYLTLRMRSDL